MNLQNLLIIFIVIALPVILILSLYIGYQVDTINMMSLYDSKLLGATYDSMIAFELNTTNNKYSTVSDSLVRDIEASIKTFTNAFSTSIKRTGASKSGIMSYIPALVYTLYDGFYIYTPMTTFINDEDTAFQHTLKPYVYYTKEYNYGVNSKLVINYSLDNYVVVYDYNKDGGNYTSKAGYLEVTASSASETEKGIYYNSSTGEIRYNGVLISKNETIVKNINKTGEKKRTSTSAYEYYKDAFLFSKWFNTIVENVFGKRNCKL